MKNQETKKEKQCATLIKSLLGQIFLECTPPEVKHSDRNYAVAKAMLAIDEILSTKRRKP